MKRVLICAVLALVAASSTGCSSNSCRPRLINWDFFSFGRGNDCENQCNPPCNVQSGYNACGSTTMVEGPILMPSTSPGTTTRILPGPVEEMPAPIRRSG